MRVFLLAAAAAVAFAVSWHAMPGGKAAVARPRPADPVVPVIAGDWPGPEAGSAPPPVPATTVDELVAAFDADLGEDGVPVNRAAIEQALRSDPELRRALGLP